MKHFRQTGYKPQLLLATLILTGILSLGAGVTKARTTTANSPRNPLIARNKQPEANLSPSIANVVLKTASQHTGLPTSSLRITDSMQLQGSSSCLGIPPRPGEVCTADLAPLWQVTVAGGQQRLVYHTSADGARIKLNETASSNLRTLAASSLLIIAPVLAFYVYHTRARKKIS